MVVLCRAVRVALVALVLPASAVPNAYILGLVHGDSSSAAITTTTTDTKTLATSTSALGRPSRSTTQVWTSTPTSQPDSAVPTTVKTTAAPTLSVVPASAESEPTDHTWQIVGIAIISVLFIATTIACAMFFDRLWRFLRDVTCCTSRPLSSEEFIPDCETQGWDTETLHEGESPGEKASAHARARELPWNTDTRDWATLHRQPSRRDGDRRTT